MFAQFFSVWRPQQRAIHGKDLQSLPFIAFVAFASPLRPSRCKQVVDRVGAQSRARLTDTAASQQIF
ncbi:hypothetical protein CPBF1521_11200 [Xanthomonas arboricola pv. juglandis]|nr:hypothetical protein CPBF1521_03850 [Xanthomonas arboricola pv. juglandis]SUZ34652.1 hypothetical protein CPBF1521_04920 [Xanthomonas arboricola pv. juglandis]SUZ35266.1 hypothetical protein CPBF1521_11200 [Xanthomonas arboricola pv. juglandis]SYZ58292.1 hypothetical protein CPBF427_03790 [Xanthomonas arboricola pv. juglandis]